MILSFRCKDSLRLFHGRSTKKFPPSIWQTAHRRLVSLHVAPDLDTIRRIPGNRLHPLKGDRQGQWAIRINDQWRICFRWQDGNALDVEIADYH